MNCYTLAVAAADVFLLASSQLLSYLSHFQLVHVISASIYMYRYKCTYVTEQVGFEPTHRFLDLPVFKTGLFSHLSTAPSCGLVSAPSHLISTASNVLMILNNLCIISF